jgi:hypothetical protein
VSKPIHFSKHALEQMRLRGASQAEVIEAMETAPAQPAKYGKFQVHKRFKYDQPSPINQKVIPTKSSKLFLPMKQRQEPSSRFWFFTTTRE